MALRHRNKQKRAMGEPIYPMGAMCDYYGCRKGGKRFEVDNCLMWLCEKHEYVLPQKLFGKVKLW